MIRGAVCGEVLKVEKRYSAKGVPLFSCLFYPQIMEILLKILWLELEMVWIYII